MGSVSNKNIFKILVATDNHLGFLEKDPVRGKDSYNTFEEVLELGVSEDVDFILLGGDLFHDNKPSRDSILCCMDLLRKYTFGKKAVNFDFISDPAVNFPNLKNPCVNYKDPNLNVAIPVFSIHGNHDDPSGLGQHSPLEMLSSAGLINYFGRVDNLNCITISPLLMTKGECKLSLYGLSAVKDQRLYRLFRENKVKMLQVKQEKDEWFNIFVLHQNHVKHSLTNYIPEEFIDKFIDLVIWGHEHECLIDPKKSSDDSFYVVQPGSSVATSLCAGEAVPKHIALLEINSEKQMRIKKIGLQTIRPFIFLDISLSDYDLPERVVGKKIHPIEEFVEDKVKEMIEKSKEQLTGHPRQPTKPLIRLRVEYTDESQMFNTLRFGYKFQDTVANPDNIILFRKFKKCTKKDGTEVDDSAMNNVFSADISQIKVEDIVQNYFEGLENEMHKMKLLSEQGLAFAVNQFVEKDYKEAMERIFDHQVKKTVEHLSKIKNLKESQIEDALENYRSQHTSRNQEEDAIEALGKYEMMEVHSSKNDSDKEEINIEEDTGLIESSSKRGRGGRGSRGGRGYKGSRGGGRSSRTNAATPKSKKANLKFSGNNEDDDEDDVLPVGRKQISTRNLLTASRNTTQKLRGARFDSDSDQDTE